LLTWDEKDWLYLLDWAGNIHGQVRPGSRLAAACAADDGSAYAACGGREIWWLKPDLMTAWHRVLPHGVLTAALDSFGTHLAVADTQGGLRVFDLRGEPVFSVQSPRPFHHLAFLSTAARLLACADYGLVACLDMNGQWIWRDGLVAHIGDFAVSDAADVLLLACYSEGLQGYSVDGKKHGHQGVGGPCRLVDLSFDGTLTLTAGLSDRLQVLDGKGALMGSHVCGSAPVALKLAALGDRAAVALADGTLAVFRIGL
jgi:hypothetical protein